jgi:uncharacterized membrane protein SirB2
MSYQVYKIIHLSSLVMLFMCIAISVYGDPKKLFKILTGVTTLLVLVSGMGLIARLNIPHASAWPSWLYVKLAIWAVVGIGAPIIIKRAPAHKAKLFWGSYVLFIIASMFANYKY